MPGMYLQDRYEILEKIGSGGMADVYKAMCHTLNRLVAIKVLKDEFSSNENFVNRFKMEAQAAARLTHPNIVNVFDVVDEGDIHYIVMELIEGITLKSYIAKKGRLEAKETIGIAIQMAQGMSAAHQHNIIHRDIKPQNIIVSKDGKVKVADFGIARAASSNTRELNAIGSVHYISPEQARGEAVDARSDIYSLGITMFEMVTGRLPFDGESTVSVAIAHLENPITPPKACNPDIPENLEAIILKCTEKRPEDRYSSAEEVIADLRRALIHPNGGLQQVLRRPRVRRGETGFAEGGQRGAAAVMGDAAEGRRDMARGAGDAAGGTREAMPGAGNALAGAGNAPSGIGNALAGAGNAPSGAGNAMAGAGNAPSGAGNAMAGAGNILPGTGESVTGPIQTGTAAQTGRQAADGTPGTGSQTGGILSSRQPEDGHRSRRTEQMDISRQLERIFAATGVVAAILIVAVLLFVVLHLGGLLKSKPSGNSPTGQASETSMAEVTTAALAEGQVYMQQVVGLLEEDARELLKDSGIRMTVSSEETSDRYPAGYIMAQEYPEGTVLERGSTVSVKVSKGSGTIDLAGLGLEGMEFQAAKTLLQEKNLVVSSSQESSDTIPAGNVIRYSPQMIREGETVMLTISSGPSMVPVPDVTGMTPEAANELLTAAGFVPEAAGSDYSNEVDEGLVFNQTAAAESAAPKGSVIQYTISLGPLETIIGRTRYIGSINREYKLSVNYGPGYAETSVRIVIRLRQEVDGKTVYKNLIEPRTVVGDSVIPIVFSRIEGADGVEDGTVELVDLDRDQVLVSYPVSFFKTEE